MNAVGIAVLENGKALGFFCGKCGRQQLPFSCGQEGSTEHELAELHRKADLCCSVRTCEKHDYALYDWHLCPHCVTEGPATDSKPVQNYTETMQPSRKRARKASAQ